jgi:hypothetical protein
LYNCRPKRGGRSGSRSGNSPAGRRRAHTPYCRAGAAAGGVRSIRVSASGVVTRTAGGRGVTTPRWSRGHSTLKPPHGWSGHADEAQGPDIRSPPSGCCHGSGTPDRAEVFILGLCNREGDHDGRATVGGWAHRRLSTRSRNPRGPLLQTVTAHLAWQSTQLRRLRPRRPIIMIPIGQGSAESPPRFRHAATSCRSPGWPASRPRSESMACSG